MRVTSVSPITVCRIQTFFSVFALSYSVGAWGAHFITLCIFLFAFSSLIGNYYYGEANLEFLTKSKSSMFIFRVLTVVFVFLGSIESLLHNSSNLLLKN